MNCTKCKYYLLLFISLCFLLSPTLSTAQTKWEQLEHTLIDSPEHARLNFYLAGAKDVFFTNRKLSEVYANKALSIAGVNANYQLEKGNIYNLLGIIATYNKTFDEADANLQKAIAIAKQTGNQALELKARTNIALNSSKRGDFQKAITQNFEILQMFKGEPDPTIASNLYANLSNAYYFLHQLKDAEQYQLKALELFERTQYKVGIGNALNTLGTIYQDLKRYDKAIEYLNKSLILKKEKGDSLGMANTYTNLATLYSKLQNTKSEMSMLLKAEQLFKALKDDEGLAALYTNFGAYYYRQKDFIKAAEYENKAIKLAEPRNNNYILGNAYENISKTYAKLDNPDTALAFSHKALGAKDSMYDAGLQKEIAAMQVRYETEKKEKQIKEQELELQHRQYMLMQRNYLITGILSLLVFVALVAYIIYRRNRLKQAIKLQQEIIRQQDLATRAVLTAEENERVRIAKDLHDGIGQMMSVAKMNLSAMEDELAMDTAKKIKYEKIINLVDESCKEVRMVSHNMMPNALLKSGLAVAIREFIEKIDTKILKVNFYSEGLNERIDGSTETILYRVIQECVNNVIKHAGANHLDISLIKDDAGISATIEDNGKGFDEKQVKKLDGIGLKNIKTRMEYLKGTVEWNTSLNKGTVVALHVPQL